MDLAVLEGATHDGVGHMPYRTALMEMVWAIPYLEVAWADLPEMDEDDCSGTVSVFHFAYDVDDWLASTSAGPHWQV